MKKEFKHLIVINREMRGFPVTILHVDAVNYSKIPHSEQ